MRKQLRKFYGPKLQIKNLLCRVCYPGMVLLLHSNFLMAQKTTIIDSSNKHFQKVVAGAEYEKSGLHQLLWGKDYRKEWTTPVVVPVLNLDSAYGGLTPVSQVSEGQTKSLQLKDAAGRVYVLRGVNKTYLGALPEIVQGTFVETLANDQIATNHPYAALTVPSMSAAAGVYHTNPKYYLVPQSSRLGQFNKTFANTICMLEERPDETQIKNPGFGTPENIVSSETMRLKILENNNHLVDQNGYLKARLFDMVIGDWSRHKDNWRWAQFENVGTTTYKPVPKDRDQTWAKFEGGLLRLIVRIGGYKELQSFEEEIKNIKWYNYPAHGIDKRFTNALPLQVWIDTARALQKYLSDAEIEKAVAQMPPEIFALSGKETITTLKGRRNHLVDWARDYYYFLAKDVEIPGTSENEIFEVQRVDDFSTTVQVYPMNKNGVKGIKPIFSRNFLHAETKQLRLYGINGNDVFKIDGKANEGLTVSVFGGIGKDSLIDRSAVGGMSHKTKFYDNPGNNVITSTETNVTLKKDTSINRYEYEVFKFDSRGVRPIFYYSSFYRFYTGIGYTFISDRAKGGNYRQKHSIGINYSIIENSFSPYFKSSFRQLIARWNLNVNLGYDQVRRLNYFGTGNETEVIKNDIAFYWMRTKTLYAGVGIDKTFGNKHSIAFDILYNATKVRDYQDGYTSKTSNSVDPSVFSWKHFIGPQFTYAYINTNDKVIPTKGIIFRAAASYVNNITTSNRSVTKASSSLNLYLPLYKAFSLASKTGAATLWGNPEFYQLNTIGGFYTLRGYWGYRFYGTRSVFNQTELRWLPNVRGRAFSGRIGLLAFYDQGRVWAENELSNKWHSGYGGGLILVPFNKVSITVTQSFSVEGRRTNVRLGRLF